MKKHELVNQMSELNEQIRLSRKKDTLLSVNDGSITFYQYHFHPKLKDNIINFVDDYLQTMMEKSNQMFKEELNEVEQLFYETKEK